MHHVDLTCEISMLHHQLALLRNTVLALNNKEMDITTFCETWRAQTSLLNSLPAKYEVVAEDLLVRLEAGRLFIEESCSFSQADLLQHLSIWIDKAEKTLTAAQ
jgi:hypothetical protein